MLKKILFGVPLLCLSLQSTGYAAGTVMKELAEFGVPAARRAMNNVRPLIGSFVFQAPTCTEKRGFSTTPKVFASSPSLFNEKLAVRKTLASMRDQSEETFFQSSILGRRYLSTKVKADDSWEKIEEVAGSFPGEIPPRLSVDDSWERIDEITRRYCVTTTGTIDEIAFKGPAKWMQDLVGSFRSLSKPSDIYSKMFRENVIDTVYTWDQASKSLPNYNLNDAQQIAVANINVIREKIVREMNR